MTLNIEQFGTSIPGRRLQLGQRRHSTTTFSRLCHLYCTEDKDRAFAVAGPRVWNSLPAALRAVEDYEQFKPQLKTHLF